MQKGIIMLGITLVVIGLAWGWIGKLPLGRLPGDIIINRPNTKIFFPVTTMILVSVVVSVLLWIFRK